MSCEHLKESMDYLKVELDPANPDWGIADQISFSLPRECAAVPGSHTAALANSVGLRILERYRSEARRLIKKYQDISNT